MLRLIMIGAILAGSFTIYIVGSSEKPTTQHVGFGFQEYPVVKRGGAGVGAYLGVIAACILVAFGIGQEPWS